LGKRADVLEMVAVLFMLVAVGPRLPAGTRRFCRCSIDVLDDKATIMGFVAELIVDVECRRIAGYC
jgi:hypothetical protein